VLEACPVCDRSGIVLKSYKAVVSISGFAVEQIVGFPFELPRWLKQGKAIPLQAWTGPEGSRRLRLPDFKTFGT